MIKNIIRFFGLKGSWKWACKQLDKGEIIYVPTTTVSCKYKLDTEAQRRICWHFTHKPKVNDIWENANIFLRDFECIKWDVWTE